MTDRELMQMALDALIETVRLAGEYGTHLIRNDKDAGHAYETIEALRARLAQPDLITPADVEQLARIEKLIDKIDPYEAQPEPEPVACDCDSPAWCKQYKKCHRAMLGFAPYVAPPQREWQGLTDEELDETIVEKLGLEADEFEMMDFARAIEAKLKEKNT